MAVTLSPELHAKFQQEFLALLDRYKRKATEENDVCSRTDAKAVLWNALKVFMLTQ